MRSTLTMEASEAMKVSVFEGSQANQTSVATCVREVTWSDLPSLITSTSWAPGAFTENRRQIKYLESIALLVLDIDDGMTIEECRLLFGPYRHIIGTSKSHQLPKADKAACDRFRVLLELSEPLTNDLDYKATWFTVQKYCPVIDPACKDASRFFFPCKEIVSVNEGQQWLVTKAPQTQPKPQAPVSAGAKLKPSKRTQNFQMNGAPAGEWHGELVAACMDLKQQQWSQSEAQRYLSVFHELDDEHDLQTIDDVFNNRQPKHPPRADGNEALRELLARCHLIENIADPEITRMVELDSGAVHDIHRRTVYTVFSKDEAKDFMNLRRIAAQYTYNPSVPGQLTLDTATGINLFNTYVPPEWKANWFYGGAQITGSAIPTVYFDFFTHLTSGHEESREFLLDWAATSLRARNYTILTAIGEQGIGKGVLGMILEMMHGKSNFAKVRDDVFKQRFNSRLAGKTLIYVDEADLRTKESQDRIKDTVNESMEIEAKGVDATSVRNWASYYLSSNSYDAVRIEAGDRRFSIIQLTDTPLNVTDWIKRIPELLDENAVSELARALWVRDIKADMKRPFRSARAAEVMEAGLNDWEDWVVFDWAPRNGGSRIELSKLQKDVETGCGLRLPPGRRKFIDLAKKYPGILTITQERGSAVRWVEVHAAKVLTPNFSVKRHTLTE